MKTDLSQLKKWVFSPIFSVTSILVFLVPTLYLLFFFYARNEELNNLDKRITLLQKKELHLKQAEEREKIFLKEMAVADHFYLDKYVETLVFLEPEIQKLKLAGVALEENTPANKRWRFLEESNRILFHKENMRTSSLLKETEEKQVRPVEMHEQDLKRVLSLVEGVTISSYGPKENMPQFLIKNFELSKKSLSAQEGVFVISMELLKREGVKQF